MMSVEATPKVADVMDDASRAKFRREIQRVEARATRLIQIGFDVCGREYGGVEGTRAGEGRNQAVKATHAFPVDR